MAEGKGGKLKIFEDEGKADDEWITLRNIEDESKAKKIRFFFNEELNKKQEIGILYVDYSEDKLIPFKISTKKKNLKEAEAAMKYIEDRAQQLSLIVVSKRDTKFVEEMIDRLNLKPCLLSIPIGTNKKMTEVYSLPIDKGTLDKFDRVINSDDPLGEKHGRSNSTDDDRLRSHQTRRNDDRSQSSQTNHYHQNAGSVIHDNNTKLTFLTANGLKVKIYTGAITKLAVDVIVNAANDTLSHAGGVAHVIAKAAGYRLENESKDAMRNHRKLSDGQNVVTTAGNLPYNAVIHAVGPSWHSYKGRREKCLEALADTVYNILVTANERGYRSVAMPPISSGIFGVPKKVCAAMYLNGIHAFCDRHTLSGLREFHIIDIYDDVLDMVVHWYKRWTSDNTCININSVLKQEGCSQGSSKGNRGGARRENSYQDIYEHSGRGESTEDHFTVPCGFSNTTIHVYSCNILQLKDIDAVVVSEDPEFKGEGGLAKTLLDHGGEAYKKQRDKLKKTFLCFNYKEYSYSKVLLSFAGGKLPFKRVLHAIINRCSSDADIAYWERLKSTFLAILEKVDSLGTQQGTGVSLAMPMIGTGGHADREMIRMCCQTADEAIWEYLKEQKKGTRIRHIHLVNGNDQITGMLCEIFGRHLQRGHPPTSPRKQNYEQKPLPSKETPVKGLRQIDTWKFDQKSSSTLDMSKYISKSEGKKKPPQTGNLVILGDDDEDDEEEILDDEDCIICMCQKTDPVKLNKCSHAFCFECISGFFSSKPMCPVCGTIYGKVYGDQPKDGSAKVFIDPSSLPGYEGNETYVIEYEFRGGKQQENHPDPGMPYEGITRRGYLPKTKDGTQVLGLLKKAFEQGLTFTIGTSRTTNKDGVITWNDIHHKTSKTGGAQRFGYPDPEYLSRVKEELAVKGITEA